jgi:protein-S-isoprenylcysteine O-methyltransferase Ste14
MMEATKTEFRLRMLITGGILFLGFSTPWTWLLKIGTHAPLILWLPLELSRQSLLPFSFAAHLVLVFAALIAAKAMIFRIWGAAYLGPTTVTHINMRGETLVASGPYRFVRNPLYIGLWSMTIALAFLMPPSGALFVLIAAPLFLLRLTLAEEAFLTRELGEPYQDYMRTVPRLVPHLRASLPPAASKPQWFRAVLSEATPIGVFIAFSVFSWSFDTLLMARVILIGFGISLVARAMLPRLPQADPRQ